MNLNKSILERMVERISGARKKEELSNFLKYQDNEKGVNEFMELKNHGSDSRSKEDQNDDEMNYEDRTDGNEDELYEQDCKNERSSDGLDNKIAPEKEEGNEIIENFLGSDKKGFLEKLKEKISARKPEKAEEKPSDINEEFFQRFKKKLLLERGEKAEKHEKETEEPEVIEVENSNPELKVFNNESFNVNSGILEDEVKKGLFCEFIQKLKSLGENEKKVFLKNKAKDFNVPMTELRVWIDAFELLLKVEKEIKTSKKKLTETETSVLFAKEFIKILKQSSSDKKFRLVKVCNIVFKGLKLDSMKAAVWLTEFVKQNKNLLDIKLLEEFGIKPENLNKKLKPVKREESNSEEKGNSRNIVNQKGKQSLPQKKLNPNLKKKVEGQSKKVKSSSESEDSSESEVDAKVSPIISQKKSETLKKRKIEIPVKEPQPKKELKIEKKEQKEKEKIKEIQKESVNALRAEMEKKLKAEMEREKTNQEKIEDELKTSKTEKLQLELTKYFSQVELKAEEKKNEQANRQYPESFCQKIANKLDEAFKSTITKILAEKSEELCLDEETLKKFYKEYGTYISLTRENQCSLEKVDKQEVVERKTKADPNFEKISNFNDPENKKIEEKSNFELEFLKLAEKSQSSLSKKVRNETIEIKKPVEKPKEKLEIEDEMGREDLRSSSYKKPNMNQLQRLENHQENIKKAAEIDQYKNSLIEKLSLNTQKEKFKSPLIPPSPPFIITNESRNEDKSPSIIMNPYEYLSNKLLGFIERHQECTESDIRKCAHKIVTKSPKIEGKIKSDNLEIWLINFLKTHKNLIKGSKSGTNGLLNETTQRSQASQNFTNPTPKIMIKNSPGQIESQKMKIPVSSQFEKKGSEMNRGLNQEKMTKFSKMPNRMSNNIHAKTEIMRKDHHFD